MLDSTISMRFNREQDLIGLFLRYESDSYSLIPPQSICPEGININSYNKRRD